MVKGVGAHTSNAIEAIEASYAANITDEFINPIVVTDANEKPLALIE